MRSIPPKFLGYLLAPVFSLLLSCGGGSNPPTTTSTSPTPTPTPPPDFSLTASPLSVTLTAGGTGQQISVTATGSNGFSAPVMVAITGLTNGVTASPASLTLTPGMPQNTTITAASSAPAAAATVTFTGTSGSLSHSATLALTVQSVTPPPPPDFSLSVTPTTLSLTPGGTGQQVSVAATGSNGFSSAVAVSIGGLPTGVTANPASLTLTPGTPQNTTLTAASTAPSATASVTFTGTSETLSHAATLALTVHAVKTSTVPDVTTYHDDNSRDGLNSRETILTPANVNVSSFGKVGFDTVDATVDAEPLFLGGLSVGGQTRNVLYVATEGDSVYAFDADSGAQLWKVSVLGSNETTSDDHGCGQITPQIGITSTPVIDRSQGPNGTIFVVGMSKDSSGGYHQRLHALDLTTGSELTGSPVEISASYPGTGDNSRNGNVVFDPGQYAERAGLLLSNGTIYLAWTSHCDQRPYTGWIMGYSESTLKQTQVLNVTPNGSEGSIWMSGDGLAADASGNIYFLDANGTFDTSLNSSGFPNSGNFGNAIMKLSTNGTLTVADYFAVYNTDNESEKDEDLGSGGELLLPDQTDSSGNTWHLIVGGGKDSNIYLADRDNLGKFNTNGSSNSNLYQEISGVLTGQVYSTPAYFNGVLYYGAVGDNLKAFPIANAKLATTPSSQSSAVFPFPGTTPAISANGTQNGIVWAVESSLSSPAVLHAYDPSNLAHELYNSNQAANGRDSFGNGNKFITPLVVNGKVYIGTQNGVAVFGELSSQ